MTLAIAEAEAILRSKPGEPVDSAGHYEVGNLQVVSQFINFWKGDSDNAEFQMLLMLVRGFEQ
jgi:hypothetical protein